MEQLDQLCSQHITHSENLQTHRQRTNPKRKPSLQHSLPHASEHIPPPRQDTSSLSSFYLPPQPLECTGNSPPLLLHRPEIFAGSPAGHIYVPRLRTGLPPPLAQEDEATFEPCQGDQGTPCLLLSNHCWDTHGQCHRHRRTEGHTTAVGQETARGQQHLLQGLYSPAQSCSLTYAKREPLLRPGPQRGKGTSSHGLRSFSASSRWGTT